MIICMIGFIQLSQDYAKRSDFGDYFQSFELTFFAIFWLLVVRSFSWSYGHHVGHTVYM